MITQIQLPPSAFLGLLRALASPDWIVTVPAAVADVKYISSQHKCEDGYDFIETTVEAPDNWDFLLCSMTIRPAEGAAQDARRED